MTHNAENDAPTTGCCQTCDAAAQGIPVPCDPGGEPIHGPYTAGDAPALGQPVTFTWTLTRVATAVDGWGPWPKRWVARQYEWQTEPEPRQGIVIGIRTLANGENRGGGWDDPITFRPTEHFTAYLVAYDLRRKPVLVLPQHVRIIPGTPPQASHRPRVTSDHTQSCEDWRAAASGRPCVCHVAAEVPDDY